ncbi:YceH family protein [Wenzhouxiangella sp. EGI_FJ10409]|uniref:YceH family protein n=1 Tax=Wenzhouxiangella sp. EGI_FJ10409 TaxID=3243767 RepID=UPI0035E1C401
MSNGPEHDGPEGTPEPADEQEDGTRLSAVEARVLGCLVEKESTTPDAYPLTLNATTTACNQKSSREPVMKLEPGRVGQALRELERKGLVRHDFSARAERYRHTAEKGLELTEAQLALITLLMLRGPQTVNELLTRTERIHRFDDADDVVFTLERLMQKQPPMVVRLPRQSGQREDRYMHLLCGPVETGGATSERRFEADSAAETESELVARLEALEDRVARLEERLPASQDD